MTTSALAGESPLRVVTVDDELPALLGLRALIAPHPDVVIVGEASSGRHAIAAIRDLEPDLVFLDVQMPEVDGFAVVDHLLHSGRPRLPAIVFVTAHDAHAVRAFAVGAVDYLLKPVATDRFAQALARARASARALDARILAERLTRVVAAYAETGGVPKLTDGQDRPLAVPEHATRLVVRVGLRDLVVPVEAIDWIEADDYCAVLHQGAKRHTVRQTLQALEARLDPSRFVRVHRSAIVQVASVASLQRHGLGRLSVTLRDGTRLPVSRSRHTHVAARFMAIG